MRNGGYDPVRLYDTNAELREALDMIRSGYFSPDHPDLFVPVIESLPRARGPLHAARRLRGLRDLQEQVDAAYLAADEWTRRAILNIAHIGQFSVDRLVREYAAKVWNAGPVHEAHDDTLKYA